MLPNQKKVAALKSRTHKLLGASAKNVTKNDNIARVAAYSTALSAAISAIGLVVSAIALWKVNSQLEEAKKANGMAQKHFVQDEQAWLSIEPIRPVLTFQGDKFVPRAGYTYDIHIKNFGKTAATKIEVDGYTYSSGLEDDSSSMRAHISNEKMFRGKVPNGLPQKIISKSTPSALAPGATSELAVSLHAQAPQLFANGAGLYDYLVGRVTYKDIFTQDHRLNFCYVVIKQSGELSYCKYGNDRY